MYTCLVDVPVKPYSCAVMILLPSAATVCFILRCGVSQNPHLCSSFFIFLLTANITTVYSITLPCVLDLFLCIYVSNVIWLVIFVLISFIN